MHTYQIVIGDWSDDGHGKTETITVSVNKTAEEINAAYRRTETLTKVSLTDRAKNKLFSEYEDNIMSKEVFDTLKEFGVNMDEILSDKYEVNEIKEGDYSFDDYGHCYSFYTESTAALYMEMAKASLPDLEYRFVKTNTLVRGIGYGLFH